MLGSRLRSGRFLRLCSASYQRIHFRTALSDTPYLRPTATMLIVRRSSIRFS